jgi:hypothetical protein
MSLPEDAFAVRFMHAGEGKITSGLCTTTA